MAAEEESVNPELVKSEFYKNTEKFHVVTCWLGIILNVVWFASDFVVLRDHWLQFVEWRITVSFTTFLVLTFRKN